MVTVKNYDVPRWNTLTMKIHEVDGSIKGTIRGRVLPGCHINEAGYVSFLDWMVYRIEVSLRLPCISHI